ncbi:hypothetical protein [Providencia sp. Je.9.19]|uniref:hypothetical protein n=1 Tax=Providencia sp. Je.9.19 TaxID=3142844 RepID=UPI003DA83850
MSVNILTDGYKPEVSFYKNLSITMESYELKSLTGDTNAIFGAMESPLEGAVEFAASKGTLDELIQMAIEKKGKDAA